MPTIAKRTDMETVTKVGDVTELYHPDNYYYDDYSEGYDDLSRFSAAVPCRPVVVDRFLRVFAPAVYSLVLLLGLTGNGMVVAVVGRSQGGRRTVTDVFILHLAVADLLLAATLPFWAVETMRGWVFGPALCKLVGAVFALNLYSGILFLVCISVDRYLAIVHAVHMYKRSKPLYVRLTCAGVWLFCASLSTVDLVFRAPYTSAYLNDTVCTLVFPAGGSEAWKVTLRLAHQLIGFALPTAAMFYCYSRIFKTLCNVHMFERHKTLRVVVAVVAVFLGCWAPYNAVLLVDTLQSLGAIRPGCAGLNALDIGRAVTQSLGLVHSCLNPLLYAFIGVKFRREMGRVLERAGCPGAKPRRRQPTRGKRGSGGGSETSTSYSTLW